MGLPVCPEHRLGAPQLQRLASCGYYYLSPWDGCLPEGASQVDFRAREQPVRDFRGIRAFRWWHSRCLFLWPGQGSSRAGQHVGASSPGEVGSWHLHTWQKEARLTMPIWGRCITGFHLKGSIFRRFCPPPALTICLWGAASGLSSDSILR